MPRRRTSWGSVFQEDECGEGGAGWETNREVAHTSAATSCRGKCLPLHISGFLFDRKHAPALRGLWDHHMRSHTYLTPSSLHTWRPQLTTAVQSARESLTSRG